MKKKDLLIMSLNLLICAFISPGTIQAQEAWDGSSITGYTADAQAGYPYNDYNYAGDYPYYSNNYDSVYSYSSIDYDYNNPYYYSQASNNKGFNGSIHFGRRFDNSNNFSSGISSYQGTSTGPGPNGGYPGTPRGIYQTNYIDTSIYPNSYMQTYRH